MKILAVHTYPGANDGVKRHYPYYEKAGADRIVGITTEGGGCYWPTEDTIVIGKNTYVNGPALPVRLVKTLEACLATGASEIIVIEWDVIFFKPLPDLPGDGVATIKTGHGGPGWRGSGFYHVPWYMNAATARLLVEEGNKLLAAGIYEDGSPDRFICLVMDTAKIPALETVFTRYTRNTIHTPEYLNEAREAYLGGVDAMHGIKTLAQLEFVTRPST